MAPEGDPVGKLIRESGNGPLGFAESNQEVEPDQIIQTEIIEGRTTKIETNKGQKEVRPKARAVVSQAGLTFIQGGVGSPIGVDNLRLLLNSEQSAQARNALSGDRKKRKQKLQTL